MKPDALTRTCASCGAKLSRYNPGKDCALCQQAQGRWPQVEPPPSPEAWLRTPGTEATAEPLALGGLLREYRATHGLSQAQLAVMLDLDQSYVSKVENEQRELRDVETLKRIAIRLAISPRDLGLAFEVPSSVTDPASPGIRDSHRHWRLVREELNRHRVALSETAAALYPDVDRVADTPLIVGPGWILEKPIDFDHVGLTWSSRTVPLEVNGTEVEAASTRSLSLLGEPYHRYSRAIRDLDPPMLFENRMGFRLLDVDWLSGLAFGPTTYFDAVDVCEAVAHELADVWLKRSARSRRPRPLTLDQLPFRALIGDPFAAARRPLLPSVNTLTIRRDGRAASMILHHRSSAQVAVAGGMYHVMPAGVFQPSSIAPWDQLNDFNLWHNVLREMSEEFLGNAEHDGSSGVPCDYANDEPFRTLNRARREGKLRILCFGIGLDPLTLWGEILSVVVIDGDVFDRAFADLVSRNAEGSLVTAGARGTPAEGIPFTAHNVRRLLTSEPIAPSAAACLHLAWENRRILLDS